MGILKQDELKDLLDRNMLKDLLGEGGSEEIYNLLLETGANILLETGGFIILESNTP